MNKQLKPQYHRVSYWLHTPLYRHPDCQIGFNTPEDRIAFENECSRIFEPVGWKVEHPYMTQGKSKLHLHPDMITGNIHIDLQDTILPLLEQSTLIHSRGDVVKILYPVFDITCEQHREYIAPQWEKIANILLEKFKTKRRNLFRVPNDLWFTVFAPLGEQFGLRAFEDKVTHEAARFAGEVFAELINDGKILETVIRNQPAFRTVKDGEQVKLQEKTTILTKAIPNFTYNTRSKA